MARAPDPRICQAKAMYLKGMKLVEIASQLSIPEGTVRRWKCTHKWDDERSDKKANVRKRKKGGQPRNKNAIGNGGGGGGSGVDVTHNGETTRYYFSEKNGMNYYQRGVGGTPQPTPLNMTVRDFTKRVQANGATVKPVTAAAKAAEQKAYEADRKAANDFLNQADTSMGGNRGDQRRATKGRRGGRRGI